MIALLGIGLISILSQVVLLRELNVAFYGVELMYALATATWMLWTALGASITPRVSHSTSRVAPLFLLFALFLPAEIAAARFLRKFLAPAPGAYLSFSAQIVAMALLLLPAGLLSGMIFQRAAKCFMAQGRSLARAYAMECLGGVVGGAGSVLAFQLGMSNLASALVCALLSSIYPLAQCDSRKWARLRIAAGFLIASMVVALWNLVALDRRMTRWNHPNLLETRDSHYGRITLSRLEGQLSLFENDALAFESESTSTEEFVHMAALQHRKPDRVLMLGGGAEGAVGEILKHNPGKVDYIELDPVLLELVMQYFPAELRAPLLSQRVRVINTDPRRYLATQADTYDLILVGMPEPASGQANRFFTQEFFSLCNSRLKPAGVLAFRISAAENLWTPQLRRRMASIYQALRATFRNTVVLPGATSIVLASQDLLPQKPDILVQRLESRHIRARLLSPPYIHYLYENDRFAEIESMLDKEIADPNSDRQPVCYRYTVMIWLSKFIPRAAFTDLANYAGGAGAKKQILWLSLTVIGILFAISRTRPNMSRALLVGAAAFIGMALETTLLLQYQVKSGILYQNIGLLLMAFMAGLAAGAAAWENLQKRVWLAPHPRRMAAVLMFAFACLAGLVALAIDKGGAGSLVTCWLLLCLTGSLVAAVFAHASFRWTQDQNSAITPLYTADLIGGCLGSTVAGLALIPLAGLPATVAVMIPLAIISFVLI